MRDYPGAGGWKNDEANSTKKIGFLASISQVGANIQVQYSVDRVDIALEREQWANMN